MVEEDTWKFLRQEERVDFNEDAFDIFYGEGKRKRREKEEKKKIRRIPWKYT